MSRDDERSIKQQTLRLLGKMQARLDAAESRLRAPVAIRGIGLRFPGADTPDEFWAALAAGQDLVREAPPERWKLAAAVSACHTSASSHGRIWITSTLRMLVSGSCIDTRLMPLMPSVLRR